MKSSCGVVLWTGGFVSESFFLTGREFGGGPSGVESKGLLYSGFGVDSAIGRISTVGVIA